MTDAELGERVLREVFGATESNVFRLPGWPDAIIPDAVVARMAAKRTRYARGWPAVEALAAECERRGWRWSILAEVGGGYTITIFKDDDCLVGAFDHDPGRAFALAMLEACK